MNNMSATKIENLRSVAVRGDVLEFKDEGETPEGIPLGKLTLRSSGLPVFLDGRWVTRPDARYIAEYFAVELFEY